MGAIVTFDTSAWTAQYPEFDQVVLTTPVLEGLFNQAIIYQVNDGSGPIPDVPTATTLMYMLVAHLAFLRFGTKDTMPGGKQGGSPVVGRISGGAQGSVSFQAQNDYPPNTPQWFQQTKYGSAWYAATLAYRTMRYHTIPHRFGPGRRRLWF